MFDGTAEVGCGGGIVDDQGNAGLVGDLPKGAEIADITAGIGDGFAEDGAGVLVNRGFHRVEIFGVNEFG